MALSKDAMRKLLKKTLKGIKKKPPKEIEEEVEKHRIKETMEVKKPEIPKIPKPPTVSPVKMTEPKIRVIQPSKPSVKPKQELVKVPITMREIKIKERIPEEELGVKVKPEEKKALERREEKIEKPMIFDFPRITEELKSRGVLPVQELEKGGVRGIPFVRHTLPKAVMTKISSEWEPPKLTDINIRYALIDPYAYSTIRWNPKLGELVYTVIEPPLTKEEDKKLDKIKELIVDLLDINLLEIKNIKQVQKYLKSKLNEIIADYEIDINEAEYNKLLYYIYRNFLGLESIEPLMQDPNIEDISCDGVNIPLFIVHRKYGSLRTNILFTEPEELNRFIIKLAQRCGKHISVAEPLLDGALPDGSRLQATFSTGRDIAMRGSTFTIRKFSQDPLTIVDLMNFGTLPARIAAYLWLAVQFKKSILISGGTATGKTSALNCLSLFLHPEDKIVSIEDTPELRLPHEHWIAKVARTGYGFEAGGRKRGEISMFDLLKAALRERPDELIVGEVRGEEAYVLFQGMATGHAGLATIHAESVDAVVNRLKTPPINLSAGLLQHLDIVMIMGFSRIKGMDVRRVKQVVEIIGVDTRTGKPITNEIFRWVPAGDYFEFASNRSYILDRIIEEKGIPEESIWEEIDRRTMILEWMRKEKIRYYEDVGRIIATYYKDPDEILKRVGEI